MPLARWDALRIGVTVRVNTASKERRTTFAAQAIIAAVSAYPPKLERVTTPRNR